MKKFFAPLTLAAAWGCLLIPIPSVLAQGTAFTYQGQLQNSGAPASGTYNFTFGLYTTNTGGSAVAGPVTNSAVTVTNGLFTAQVDFGAGVWDGATKWLQIGVETNDGSSFTLLSPRQRVTPAPYAITAENLDGTLAAAQLSGTVSNSQLANSSITINTTNGLTGGATVALGGSVTLGSTATSADTANAIVSRDASGNFSAGSLTLAGTLALPTAPATIYSGTSSVFRVDANFNFFAGPIAGNLTTSGLFNTANGYEAFYSNTSGSYNTANGAAALYFNTSGWDNTANGNLALLSNTSGSENTANGQFALVNNTSGSYNIALGYEAGNNITTGSYNIEIGNGGVSGDTNIIRIGSGQTSTYIAGVIQSPLFGGNVGLGTTNPETLLQVAGTNGAAIRLTGPGGPGSTVSFDLSSYDPATNLPAARLLATDDNWGDDLDIQTKVQGAATNGLVSRLRLSANGNVGIGNTAPAYPLEMGSGAYCSAGGVWTSVSDRNAKENFAAIAPGDVLAKVAALPISQWKYKAEPQGSKHIGPVAQDFHAAFGLNGADDRHISSVDEGGVALAAIQGLNQKVEKDAEIQEQAAEIQALKGRLDKLEQFIASKKRGAQ